MQSNAIPMYGIRFPRLQTLNMAGNQIKGFCFPPVNFAPKVEIVISDSNYLQVIYLSGAHNPRYHKVYIYLNNNPWHCNGSLGWAQQCIQEAHLNTMMCLEWLVVQGMICASPPGAQGLTPKEAGGKYISKSYPCKCNVIHQNRFVMAPNDGENIRPYVPCHVLNI